MDEKSTPQFPYEPLPNIPPVPPPPSPVQTQPVYLVQQKTKRSVFLIVSVILLFLGLVCSGLLNFVLLVALGASSEPELSSEKVLVPARSPNRIAVINVKGIIADAPLGLFGGRVTTPAGFKKMLDRAEESPSVKAVILNVNSPGGGVGASDLIHSYIADFKKRSKKPVIVYMNDLAASGGYYVSAGADQIVASPTAVTGSIGVIMPSYNMKKLYSEKLGIEYRPIKSAEKKDILSEARDMTGEEQKVLQDVIDTMFTRFCNLVKEGRGARLKSDKFKEMTDGRIFLADKAMNEYGLVDKVGYFDTAVQTAIGAANIPDAQVIEYQTMKSFFSAITEESKKDININLNLPGMQADLPRFMYLWEKGL